MMERAGRRYSMPPIVISRTISTSTPLRQPDPGGSFLPAKRAFCTAPTMTARHGALLPSPYGGSWFGALALDANTVLVAGLRGRLFRSEDAGENWTQIETGTTATLTDLVQVKPDLMLITGPRRRPSYQSRRRPQRLVPDLARAPGHVHRPDNNQRQRRTGRESGVEPLSKIE